jgi:hypothetical protein
MNEYQLARYCDKHSWRRAAETEHVSEEGKNEPIGKKVLWKFTYSWRCSASPITERVQ